MGNRFSESMRSLLVLFGLSLSLILAGCGTPPERRLDAPAIQITALTPNAITLRLINPNTVPVIVKTSVHTLYLGDTSIGKFEDLSPAGLPPIGSDTRTVPLPAKLNEAISAFFKQNPGSTRATIQSTLVLVIGNDDTLSVKTGGSGIVKP